MKLAAFTTDATIFTHASAANNKEELSRRPNHPVVIIITGEEGLQHGYSDRYRPDGAFEYFGEGQVGDMQIQRGNRALAEHSISGKSLLLFRKTDDGVRFEGEMVYEGHHVERAPDRTGAERNAIVFELRPLEAIAEIVEAEGPPVGRHATRSSSASIDSCRRPFAAFNTRRPECVSAKSRCQELCFGAGQRNLRRLRFASAIRSFRWKPIP